MVTDAIADYSSSMAWLTNAGGYYPHNNDNVCNV